MTNAERRHALNLARSKALVHALAAEPREVEPVDLGREGRQEHIDLARMWSIVAEALKDGDPVHDGPDGHPISTDTLTR